MEQAAMFPKRVTQGDDGAYRWTYDLKAHGNFAALRTMVGVCAAVAVPIALVMLVMTWGFGRAQAALTCLGLLALMVGLPALIWWLSPPDPSFRLAEAEIEAWPKGRNRNLHSLRDVKQVLLRPDIDRIPLRWAVTGLHIYVPPEDFDLVLEHILARVPEGTEITRG